MKTVKSILFCLMAGINALISAATVRPSLGAKQGTITAPTGADENLKTLGSAQPVRDTLAGITRTALQLASALKIAIINFAAAARSSVIVPSGTTITSVTGGTGMSLVAELVKDDTSKATSPWSITVAGSNSAVEDPLATLIETTSKPSFSVESLLNQIEDLSDELIPVEGFGFLAVVDQANGTVKVYGGSPTNLATAKTNALALTEDVGFIQTLDSGGTQFGE